MYRQSCPARAVVGPRGDGQLQRDGSISIRTMDAISRRVHRWIGAEAVRQRLDVISLTNPLD